MWTPEGDHGQEFPCDACQYWRCAHRLPQYLYGVSEFGERGACESCGTPDEIIYKVQREYLSTEPGGQSTVLPDVEKWCFACCTHYPHRMLD
jgi:hypothetical protein